MLVLESEEEENTACQAAIYNMAPPNVGPRELDRCGSGMRCRGVTASTVSAPGPPARAAPTPAVPCPCRLFPPGARMAVKEPFFKVPHLLCPVVLLQLTLGSPISTHPLMQVFTDGTQGIRVDNPSDIIFLPPEEEHGAADASVSGGGSAAGRLPEPDVGASSDPKRLRRHGNELYGCTAAAGGEVDGRCPAGS